MGVSGDYSYWPFFSREDTLLAGTLTTYQIDSLRLKDGEGSGYSFYAYATLQHKFGNFTLKGGLRSEYDYYDYRILNSPDDNVKKAYWSLYPSLHLSYRTESMHNFRLSYTRRVQNPGSEQLTTFISYSEDSYSMGNPELKQAFTNSVEAGWTKYFQKFGSVGLSAYFKHSNNEISSLSDVAYSDIFGRIVTFSYPMNVGKSINTGAEVNVTYRLKEFMNIRFYGNVYYSKSEFDFRNGAEPTKVDNLGYSFRLNFWAKLWKVLEVHASAYYSSKNVSLFYVTKPRYGINCGLRADFLDRKISVHLNVNDIFNWNANRNENKNPSVCMHCRQNMDSLHVTAEGFAQRKFKPVCAVVPPAFELVLPVFFRLFQFHDHTGFFRIHPAAKKTHITDKIVLFIHPAGHQFPEELMATFHQHINFTEPVV